MINSHINFHMFCDMCHLGPGGGIADYRTSFLGPPPTSPSLPCPLGAFMLPLEILGPPQSHLSSCCATEKGFLAAWYHILSEFSGENISQVCASYHMQGQRSAP